MPTLRSLRHLLAILSVAALYACATVDEQTGESSAALGATFLYASSDSCGNTPVAIVGAGTNCDNLAVSGSIWSVQVDGACIDISDTDARTACRLFSGSTLLYGTSDSCSGSPIAAVGPQTPCHTLGSGSVWSVKVAGRCFDISDTDVRSACERFAGDVLFFERSDSCSGAPIAALGAGSNCSAQSSSVSVWSVFVQGQCLDIQDTNLRDACERYAGGGGAPGCIPRCNGLQCGSDGCGGSCGTCSSHQACVGGACVCVPNCSGQQCGADGCGGSCGTCGIHQQCQGGSCVCIPQCNGARCGADGCGGVCGRCGDWESCVSGQCRPNPTTPPECSHGLCESGVPLAPECSTCVARVCASKPQCCSLRWDASCVRAARDSCGECP